MIGLTKSDVFLMVLKDWIEYAAWLGAKVVFSQPHPDVAKEYSAGSMHIEFTKSDVRPDPLVKEAIYAAGSIVGAVGRGQSVFVEKLPVEEDEEVKYTITIKKPKTGGEL